MPEYKSKTEDDKCIFCEIGKGNISSNDSRQADLEELEKLAEKIRKLN